MIPAPRAFKLGTRFFFRGGVGPDGPLRGVSRSCKRSAHLSSWAYRPRKRLDDALDASLLELECRLVHHEVAADVHDALDLDEVVGLEGVAGGDQIDDGVRQARERG